MRASIRIRSIIVLFPAIIFFTLFWSSVGLAQTQWEKDFANNPVLDLGPDGSWDDFHVGYPTVLFYNNEYKMWYTGYDGAHSRIGYATNANGINWIKYDDPNTPNPPFAESDPVLDLGPDGSWDDFHVGDPTVFFDSNKYKMWYAGYDGSVWRIGYATSADGINWTKYDDPNTTNPPFAESDPVLVGGALNGISWDHQVWGPFVLFNGADYEMWYSGHEGIGGHFAIGHATSSDDINWIKYDDPSTTDPRFAESDPVLDKGGPGWEGIHVGYPTVLFDGVKYEMWYNGWDSSLCRIGYAISVDGIVWERYEHNPVLDTVPGEEWEINWLVRPCVIFDNCVYKMWYTGGDSSNHARIGYASIDFDGDGIHNNVDEEPYTESNEFSDETTSGRILGLGAGICIGVMDADEPAEGIRVVVSGPPGEIARLKIDGSKGLYKLAPGEYIFTSGTVTLEVAEGRAEVEFIIGGNPVLVVVEAGGIAELEEQIVGEELQKLTVSAVAGTVTVNGVTLSPGGSRTFISVSIDIKPGSYPNSINIASKGVIPVAILSSEDFDAIQVDPSTVSLSGAGVAVKGKGNALVHQEDVNGDGLTDLLIQVDAKNLNPNELQSGRACLIGQTYMGELIAGSDEIVIVPPKAAPAKPSEFALYQNFSNPSNPDTWIPYQLAEDVDVTIRVYDAFGHLVRTLNLGHKPAGFYTSKDKAAYWDGENEAGEPVASGAYFYTMQAGESTSTRKMLILR